MQCPKCGNILSGECSEFDCCIFCGTLLIERPKSSVLDELKASGITRNVTKNPILQKEGQILGRPMIWLVIVLLVVFFLVVLLVISTFLKNPIDILYILLLIAMVYPTFYIIASRNWIIHKEKLKIAVEEHMPEEKNGSIFFMWMLVEAWVLPFLICGILFLAFLFYEFFSYDFIFALTMGVAILCVYIFDLRFYIKTVGYYNMVFSVSEKGIERRKISRDGTVTSLSIRWNDITRAKVMDHRENPSGESMSIDEMEITLYSDRDKMKISSYLTNSDKFFKMANEKIPLEVRKRKEISPFSYDKPIERLSDL